MVKRYDLHFGGAVGDYIDEVDDGDYVSHSDYAALEARCAELERKVFVLEGYKSAYNDFSDKTDWVQDTAKPNELGMHRADVLKCRIAELEKDAARYRAIMDNEWLDRNMQPSALREAAATKAGGMLEAVLDQCIDEA